MSTRCNVEIYDNFSNEKCGCLLYHHCDGYPEFMENNLKRYLDHIYKYLQTIDCPYWWDAERVGALMVMFSAAGYGQPNYPEPCRVPDFQPCTIYHGDIDYLWSVYLKKDGEYEIRWKNTWNDID